MSAILQRMKKDLSHKSKVLAKSDLNYKYKFTILFDSKLDSHIVQKWSQIHKVGPNYKSEYSEKMTQITNPGAVKNKIFRLDLFVHNLLPQ